MPLSENGLVPSVCKPAALKPSSAASTFDNTFLLTGASLTGGSPPLNNLPIGLSDKLYVPRSHLLYLVQA